MAEVGSCPPLAVPNCLLPPPVFSIFNIKDRRKLARGEQLAQDLVVLPFPGICGKGAPVTEHFLQVMEKEFW